MNEFNENKIIEDLLKHVDRESIIVEKVFTSCQHRECIPNVEIDLGERNYKKIQFKSGFIVPNTLIINDIENRPHFRRVRFTFRIPFQVTDEEDQVVEGYLPDVEKDIIMFIPEARDEFQFEIIIDTNTDILGKPLQQEKVLTFAVGIFVIIKVVGTVQLLIPSLGYSPEPSLCEEFDTNSVYDEFDSRPFPEFFPLKFEQIEFDF